MFNEKETSVDSSKPVELYTFTHVVNAYRYSTGDNIAIGFDVYSSAPITRSNIASSSDPRSNSITITCPHELKLLELFLYSMPAEPVYVTIQKLQLDSMDYITEWVGKVIAVTWDMATANLECESLCSFEGKKFATDYINIICTKALYSEKCRVDKNNFALFVYVDVSGNALISDTFEGYQENAFAGGMVEFTIDYITRRQFIVKSSGNSIYLHRQIPFLESGMQVKVYPGCDHTIETCKNRFNNIKNYGGFPTIPLKNPFSSASSIFW